MDGTVLVCRRLNQAVGIVRLAYFVHNLNDPAVARRIQMLTLGGCDDVVVLGFRRGGDKISNIAGAPVVELGVTRDGSFKDRMLTVAAAAARLGYYRDLLSDCTVMMGRTLEGGALASMARDRFAPGARLAYECLDVHRLSISGRAAPLLRGLEARLLARSNLLIVSSPAYERFYFRKYFNKLPPILLIENKVLEGDVALDGGRSERPVGPPWRIGWFGALRCRESLHMLARLADRLEGRIEVIIRGTPSDREMPDFGDVVNASPYLTFLGRYDRTRDLSTIYSDVHFAWSIDRFEKGGNGDWALSNRLYEGGVNGAVLIAERQVAMGEWLDQHGTGLLVGSSIEDELAGFFRSLDFTTYTELAALAGVVPRCSHVAMTDECQSVVSRLVGSTVQAWPGRHRLLPDPAL